MKPLNSILIEGDLADAPVLSVGSDDLSVCSFSIVSGTDTPSVPIVAYSRLATRCKELLDRGSSIRVVGRIAQDREASAASGAFKLHIIAEHIEIKPSVAHRAEVA